MEWIQVDTADGQLSFPPGSTVEGVASWHLDAPPASVELRLFWYTEGKGDQDLQIVQTVQFGQPGEDDRRAFRVQLPAGPYSFSGKLISLIWALEVVAEPGARAGRTPLVLSPTGREILLHPGIQGASPG
jgi:hypothetical protein